MPVNPFFYSGSMYAFNFPVQLFSMKKYLIAASIFTIIVSLGFGVTEKSTQPLGTPLSQTEAIVKATTAFLNTLNEEQRGKILFDFTYQKTATLSKGSMGGGPGGGAGGRPGGGRPQGDSSRRQNMLPGGFGGGRPQGDSGRGGRGGGGGGIGGEQYGKIVWSNFPISFVQRPGLKLGSLTAVQRTAAMNLLKELLSKAGYQKVQEIMGSDQILADQGADFEAGNDNYLLAIFGTPNVTTPWMVEFGGHHLALNIVIAGAQGALTPTLTGAQPSIYQLGGKTIRVLAAENDKAFALLDALDEDQRKKAVLNYRIGDLVLGPGHDGETIVPEGVKASSLNASQKEMLLDLISEWAGIISNPYVEARMKEIKAGIEETYFAWSGPLTHAKDKNGSSYYRIQGPRVIIEFSPQGMGGDASMHVHTIYRDPLNNYGNAFRSK